MSPRTKSGSDVPEWAIPQLREPRYSQSLERGLAILGCFTPEQPVLGIAEIADELGMSRSTTHRYVITLLALGYLDQEPSRKYRLGLRVTDLGMNALNSMGMRENAHPYLEALVRRTNFTCGIAVLDGIEIIYLDRVRAHRRGYNKSSLTINSGSRLAAAVTATGKLLLANLPDPEQTTCLSEIKLKKCGPNTILTKTELRNEFLAIGELGLATDDEELETGFCSIAVAIRDESKDVVGAIDLVAPRTAIGLPELVSALGPHLRATADDISARLGYRLGTSENSHNRDV